MSNNMIECGICRYHYHENRLHCPTCGTNHMQTIIHHWYEKGTFSAIDIRAANGAERARQLPQSPRFFQLVD